MTLICYLGGNIQYISVIGSLVFILFIAFKASFTVSGNTLDSGVFTYVSVLFSTIIVVSICLSIRARNQRDEHLIIKHDNFGRRPFSVADFFPLFAIPFTMFFTIVITISNEKYLDDEVVKIDYTVTCKGQRLAKGGVINYLCIDDGEKELKFESNDIASNYFSVGEKITVSTREGYWGYLVIQGLHKKKVRKALDAQAVTCVGLSAAECARYFSP